MSEYQSGYTGAEIDERLEWAEEISPHIIKNMNTEAGIHGIRYWQDTLEYHNGTAWVEIETGGAGFIVSGLYADLSDLVSAHPIGAAGDAYAVGTNESNEIYIWSVVTSEWASIGTLRGEKGEPGQNGVDGTDGVGVPEGGTAGQVLSKIDGTNYNTQWVNPSGGSGKAADVSIVDSGGHFTSDNVEGALQESADLISTKAPTANPTFTGLITTAGQVKFPSSQSASTDANTLDDYEEGVFDPVVAGTTSAGTGTYTNKYGYYTKIGNRVFFTIYVGWSAHTGTGNLTITGLPFACGSASYNYTSLSVRNWNVASDANTFLQAYASPGSSVITFENCTIATGAIAATAMDTAGVFEISGSYQV